MRKKKRLPILRTFRGRLAVGLAVLAAVAMPAWSSPVGANPQDLPHDVATTQATSADATIDSGLEALDAKDYQKAYSLFGTAMHSADFAALPERRRFLAFEGAGEAALAQDDNEKAYQQFLGATALDSAEDGSWHNRLDAAFRLRNNIDAAHCVAIIARRWPKTLDQIKATALFQIRNGVESDPSHPDGSFEMIDALFDAGWKDPEHGESLFWRELARMLLARHQDGKARKVADQVQDTRMALSMVVDKRFDAITSGNAHFDIDRLARDNLASARREVAENPDRLVKVTSLASRLRDSMRYDEILQLADDVIAQSRDGQGPKRYADFDDQYNWLLNQREDALAALGRWDEATRELERAARRPEQGEMNVSQIINLGALYASLGRAKDASEAVTELGSMSPFGKMELEWVRLRAAIELHDAPAIASHLAYMREHRADAIGTWNTVLVLDGELDAAAGVLIERLRSDAWRTDALSDMQHYGQIARTPPDAELEKEWLTVCDRPDVQAALAAVGRVKEFQISPEAF